MNSYKITAKENRNNRNLLDINSIRTLKPERKIKTEI